MKLVCFSVLCTVVFLNCHNNSKKTNDPLPGTSTSYLNEGPDYNYTVEVPDGWTTLDTSINGLNIRFLRNPVSPANENPVVNILIASMNGKDIETFTESNISYLLKNSGYDHLVEKGKFEVGGTSARWFTYYREDNGTRRDMINYIIPSGNFAYMITGGVNAGGMKTYRPVFDGIARSFKLPSGAK
jgi:hypothetical protein